jgi:hypothetical protein
MGPKKLARLIREYAESIFVDYYSGDQRRSEFQDLLIEHLEGLADYIEDNTRYSE